jgi:hypothetical protein
MGRWTFVWEQMTNIRLSFSKLVTLLTSQAQGVRFFLLNQQLFFNFPCNISRKQPGMAEYATSIFDFRNSKYRIKKRGKENLDTNFDVLTTVTLNTSGFSNVTPRILVVRQEYFIESYSVRIDG